MIRRFTGLSAGVMLFALVVGVLTSDSSAQDRNLGRIDAKTVDAASGKKAPPKFVSLLEPKDFTHFRGYQSEEIPDGWKIEGKNLIFDGDGEGDIITKETYKDFELQLEWSIEKAGNSGIMFHVTLGDDAPYYSGPEFQILDDDNAGDGKNELTSAGALYGLYPATGKKLSDIGKWNKSRIIVKGNQLTHYLNGVKVVEVEAGSDDWNERLEKSKFKDWEKFNTAAEGHIAFQNHGDPVKFRNIRVKRLDDEEKPAAEDSEQGDGANSGKSAGAGADTGNAAVPGEATDGPPQVPGRGVRGGGAPEPPSKGPRRR